MKKMIIVVMLTAALVLFLNTGYYEKLKEVFTGSKIKVEQEAGINLSGENCEFTDKGIIMSNDMSLWLTDVTGEKKWQYDSENFGEKVYCFENIYRTGKDRKTLEIINYSGELLGKVRFEDEIFHLFRGKNLFVVLKTHDNKDKYVILNSRCEVLEQETYDKGKITFMMDTIDTEGYYIAGFAADGSMVKTFLNKHVSDGAYQLWKINFENEIILDLFSEGKYIFARTNKMLYMIDENGKIMWRYSGKGYPSKALSDGIDTYILDDENANYICILGKDGQIRETIEMPDKVTELFETRGKIIAAVNNRLYGIRNGIAFEIGKFEKTPDKIFHTDQKIYIIEEDKIKVYDIIIE